MRTIEEVVKDIKSGEWAYDEAYSSGYDKLCGLLDEILEISKANESVNGDLISRSLLIEKLDADFAEGLIDCFDDIVGIVENQPTAYNDGWIPCSERLPDKSGWFLCTQEYHSLTDGKLMKATTELVEFYDNKWRRAKNLVVTHWQPLPPAYQPKGE